MILYDKPAGVTSHDVVATVRRRLGRGVKVGHAGTLDPFATGLLLILVGRATRVQRLLLELPKRYETVARFGALSTTGDPEGEITETGVVPVGALGLPTGKLTQRPPAYSAIKVGGVRAYALARAGVEVEIPERKVNVYAFDELWCDGDRRAFAIECSSGTYIRSLVMELGDAYCVELRRTTIGRFAVADADPDRIIGLNDALDHLPAVELSSDEALRASHGVAVAGPEGAVGVAGAEGAVGVASGHVLDGDDGEARDDATDAVRLLDADGLIAVAERRGGMLKPVIGFRG